MGKHKAKARTTTRDFLRSIGVDEYRKDGPDKTDWHLNASKRAVAEIVAKISTAMFDRLRTFPSVEALLRTIPQVHKEEVANSGASEILYRGAYEMLPGCSTFGKEAGAARKRVDTATIDFRERDESFADVPLTNRANLSRPRTIYVKPDGAKVCKRPGDMSYDEFPLYIGYLSHLIGKLKRGLDDAEKLFDSIQPFWSRHHGMNFLAVLDELHLLDPEPDDDEDDDELPA